MIMNIMEDITRHYGDYMFEYKDTVKQLNVFNFNLIKSYWKMKR